LFASFGGFPKPLLGSTPLSFQHATYALKLEFSRNRTSSISNVSVRLCFDRPSKWVILSFDYITDIRTPPFSRWDRFLLALGLKNRHFFSTSFTAVDPSDFSATSDRVLRP
jgi:hypothetical protein